MTLDSTLDPRSTPRSVASQRGVRIEGRPIAQVKSMSASNRQLEDTVSHLECAHRDYIGGNTWQICGRPAKQKSWHERHVPDIKATWLCWFHFYREYMQSGHWEMLRLRKLRTGDGKCERCHTPAQRWLSLHVHHKTYDTLGAESLDDLEVLCSLCHDAHHKIVKQ